jgi:hypothetical protein
LAGLFSNIESKANGLSSINHLSRKQRYIAIIIHITDHVNRKGIYHAIKYKEIFLFSAFGAFLLIFYFKKKDMDFIREGFYVGPSRINMITLGVS